MNEYSLAKVQSIIYVTLKLKFYFGGKKEA